MLKIGSFSGWLAVTLVAVAATTLPASAQSTNAHPVITMNAAMLDSSELPFVGKDARQAFVDAVKKLKSGDYSDYVFAASPDGKVWSDRTAAGNKEVGSVEDLARRALEACEYWDHAPCVILSINGHDARDATGSWPVQPQMLEYGPSAFDAQRVPFVTQADRSSIGDYGKSTEPRALILTDLGDWYWDTGKTVLEAIASTASECEKNHSASDCLLYAVGNRVVLQP